jgi:hypothetical protein
MGLKLSSSSGGSVELNPPVTASNFTLTVPATNGSVVTADTNGNVGINQNNPQANLHISGTMLQTSNWPILGSHNSGSANAYPTQTNVGIGFAWNFTGGGREMAVMNNDASGGNGFRFLQRTGTSTNTFVGSGSGAGVWVQGNNSTTWTSSSDERIKQNIRPVNNALDKIGALIPCHFEYIDKVGKIKTGFIAQEFETVLPGHIVEQDTIPEEYKDVIPEGEKLKGIDADLIPYLVKAIQELNAKVEAQALEIKALKGTE